ncbi:hypothetical protein TNCV_2954021 [Trichonephila clavipes]|nr:hypothetical protein TNCV_2954021 [Trichonephila clavipes]
MEYRLPEYSPTENKVDDRERQCNVWDNVSMQKIVEVEIGGDIYRPFGEFRRAKSYCHLYGAQGQRQAYL